MGNHLRGMSTLLSNAQFPYQLQMGKDLVLDCISMGLDGSSCTLWSFTCQVDGSFCSRNVQQYKSFTQLGCKALVFRLYNDNMLSNNYMKLVLKVKKNSNLLERTEGEFCGMVTVKNNEKCNSFGGATKTQVAFYGNQSKGALIVIKDRMKKGDMEPYRVTLEHYYAVLKGNVLGDYSHFGISIAVDVEVKNNEFNYIVKGPILHPSSALFFMFDQVLRTGIWNPMDCPHCAAISSIYGFPRNISTQSESEDNKSSTITRVGVPGNGNGNGNTQGLLNNTNITGNGNGNMIMVFDKELNEFVRKLCVPKTN